MDTMKLVRFAVLVIICRIVRRASILVTLVLLAQALYFSVLLLAAAVTRHALLVTTEIQLATFVRLATMILCVLFAQAHKLANVHSIAQLPTTDSLIHYPVYQHALQAPTQKIRTVLVSLAINIAQPVLLLGTQAVRPVTRPFYGIIQHVTQYALPRLITLEQEFAMIAIYPARVVQDLRTTNVTHASVVC